MNFHFKRSFSATHLPLSFRVACLAAIALSLGGIILQAQQTDASSPDNIATLKKGAAVIYSSPLQKGTSGNTLVQKQSEKLAFANKGGVRLIAVDLGKPYDLNTVNLKFTKPAHARVYVLKSKPQGKAPPPSVSSSEMKLAGVQGPVSIKLADGNIKPVENDMILPSGATVLTLDNASAAVYMGGVNSARILPDSEATITQNLSGSVRHTSIDLHQGTVFSHVGRQSGETQDYEVRTPEGVAAARGTGFACFYGKGADGKFHLYVFVSEGTVSCLDANQALKLVSASLGSLAMPPSNDIDQIFQTITEEFQSLDGVLASWLNLIKGLNPDVVLETPSFSGSLNGAEGEYLVIVFDSDPGEFSDFIVTGFPTPHRDWWTKAPPNNPLAEPPIPSSDFPRFHVPPASP